MTPETPLDWALLYAARGWLVFPCHTPCASGCSCLRADCSVIGKHPRTLHGLYDATTNEETIRKWWGMWPEANIAIKTGIDSGFIAIDVDPRNGGDESLDKLAPLPKTATQLTGGGGRHLLFDPEGVELKSGSHRLGRGLDLKAEGGYVIACPSLHASGGRYEWDGTEVGDILKWSDESCHSLRVSLVAAPSGLRNVLMGEGSQIVQGQRDNALASLAGTMRRRGMVAEEIMATLLVINRRRCVPPLPRHDLERIASSICGYAPTDDAFSSQNYGTSGTSKFLPPQTPRPLVPAVPGAYKGTRGTTQPPALRGLAEGGAGTKELNGTKQRRFIPLAEFLRMADEEPPVEWVVPQVVPAEGSVYIVSPPNVGKTWLALIVARAGIEQGRQVLLCEDEGTKRQLATRIRTLGFDVAKAVMGIDLRSGLKLDEPSDVEELYGLIQEHERPLLILDPLRSYMRGDENDATEAAGITAVLSGLIRLNPRTLIVLLHHSSKLGSRGEAGHRTYEARGSSVFSGWCDTQLNLSEAPCVNGVIRFGVEVAKMRASDRGEPTEWSVELSSGLVSSREISKSRQGDVDERILEFAQRRQEAVTKNEIWQTVGGRKANVLKRIDELCGAGSLERLGSGRYIAKGGKGEGT